MEYRVRLYTGRNYRNAPESQCRTIHSTILLGLFQTGFQHKDQSMLKYEHVGVHLV